MHPYIHAETTPDKPAYIMAKSGETVTYRQLDQQSNRIAQLFRSLELRPGDHVALFLENNARFFEICWAAQRAGLIYTAISSRLTAAEVDYIAGDCGARVLITSKYLEAVAAELAPLLEGVARRYMIDGTIAGYESWEATVARFPPAPIADQTAGHDMLYSSGTTGQPKGVLPVVEPQPIDFDRNLRRTENMPGGMQRDLCAGKADPFTVSQGLCRAGEILAIAQPHQIERLWRCQHGAVAGAGMIGMGMGDDGALDRPGRVDMESAAFAADTGRRGDENVFWSDHES